MNRTMKKKNERTKMERKWTWIRIKWIESADGFCANTIGLHACGCGCNLIAFFISNHLNVQYENKRMKLASPTKQATNQAAIPDEKKIEMHLIAISIPSFKHKCQAKMIFYAWQIFIHSFAIEQNCIVVEISKIVNVYHVAAQKYENMPQTNHTFALFQYHSLVPVCFSR